MRKQKDKYDMSTSVISILKSMIFEHPNVSYAYSTTLFWK